MAAQSKNQDISRRYANAVFALAREQNAVPALAADLEALQKALADSADLQKFISNATLHQAEQLKALKALGAKAGWSALTQQFLGTLVQKRRLNALSSIVEAALGQIAESKNEITARVTAAQKLDAKQIDGIAAALKKITGKTVKVKVSEDAAIMGGLIINIGSQLIDSSVRSKLERLHRSLKNSNSSQGQKKIREVA